MGRSLDDNLCAGRSGEGANEHAQRTATKRGRVGWGEVFNVYTSTE